MSVDRSERHRGAVRVLIADDHQVVREGLRMILSEERETIEVVGEAADGHEAVREAERLKPDVVLMDLLMPGLDGVAATEKLRAGGAGPRILIFTTYADDERVRDAIRAGATGYLLKDVLRGQLVQAIHAAALDVPTLDPRAQQHLMRQVASPPTPSPFAGLTPRELDVLRLVARGLGNKQIAAELTLSEHTVHRHVANILLKLDVSSRAAAAAYAARRGLAG